MASTSTSSSVQKRFKYDVFLSFRGDDTRKKFVDHLYHALQRQSIITYKDDEKITKGNRISDELIGSIEDSRFYIIVFSKNYAFSSWCLDELVKIMECQKTTDQTAYPVFYDIKPTEVRHQSGSVGEAFAKHEKNEAAEKWRLALKGAADLAGWELKNTSDGHEAKFIQKIVQEISLELRFIDSSVDRKLIGMESRVKDVVLALDTGSDDVRMIGIKGMGGVGKTTLARAVFDHISSWFEGKSFVENVREVSKASLSGLKKLQKQVLSDVLNDQLIKISSVHDGKNMMRKMMCGRKVLVVLDDVDHKDQLEALAGDADWFKSGSRIIITTREEQVLVAHRVNLIHDVNLLSEKEAICLFSRFAFGREIPTQGYEEVSRQAVHYAAGLPLTLKVLGSFLCGKTDIEWEDALERLKTIPLRETLEKLELSYIGLEEDYKEIFLDVACIMKGWKKETAIQALQSCGFRAITGLRVLEQKSLITVSGYEELGMHDHIEEMGKNIVRRSHPDEPNRHSRLWIQEEIEDILTNELGTEATRCISMEMTWDDRPETFMRGFGKMKKLRVVQILGDYSGDVIAKKMEKLRVGQCFPHALRYLRWDGYPFKSLMQSFQDDHLVGLTLCGIHIIQFWEGGERKVLHKLRFFDMSNSRLQTLNLEMTPNIETLNLQKCYYLEELNNPFECSKLKAINLHYCVRLRTLKLASTPHLETLSLTTCREVVEFNMPFCCPKLKVLKVIHLPKLRTLDLRLISNLETLSLEYCYGLVELHMPYECRKLRHVSLKKLALKNLNLRSTLDLETLRLEECHDLFELHMPSDCRLRNLSLKNLALKNLNLRSTRDLETLRLEECHDLLELHMPSDYRLRHISLKNLVLKNLNLRSTLDLETFRLEECHDLLELHMPNDCRLRHVSLKNLALKNLNLRSTPDLETLRLEKCLDLLELHMPFRYPKLKSLSLKCLKLRTLDLLLISDLEILCLEECHDLEEVQMPNDCPNLKYLKLVSNSSLKNLNLGQTSDLETLSLQICPNLIELSMPFGCPKLKCLNLQYSKLRTLNLALTPNLETLDVKGCHDFVELHISFQCPKLKALNLNCSKLRTLDLGLSSDLETLCLQECGSLAELQIPNGCPNLKFLVVENSNLRKINLGLTPEIEVLRLEGCHDLSQFHFSFQCPKLKSFSLNFSKLRTLDLRLTPNLETLSLEECRELVELHMPSESPKLKYLNLKNSALRNFNLGSTPNLETLSLEGCHDLVELHIPFQCPYLNALNLKNLALRNLNLGSTPNLETLSLEGCHDLVELHIPFQCPKLSALNLKNLALQNLNLGLTPDLETLSIEKCDDLVELRMPFRCPKLSALNLFCSKLRSLDFGPTLDLETLSLERCDDLVELRMPNECPNLKSLSLRSSTLNYLSIGLSPNLETLWLEECHDLLEVCMPFRCPKLKVLSFECSKLRSLNLGHTPDLETLSLEGCSDLVELHMPFDCPKLKSLSLNNPKLRSVNLGLTANLERLKIKECFNFVELGPSIGCLEKLVYLDLSDCGGFTRFSFYKHIQSPVSSLHMIGKSIDTCPLHSKSNLPKFRFSCLFEETIPSSIGNLGKLISIGLCACTDLESFSRSICYLRGIGKLTLEGDISEVPKDLDRFKNLEELSLLSTTVKYLPDSICMLKHLKLLQLNSCLFIEKLPEGLGRLECLEDLNLTLCIRLQDIPKSICDMRRLKHLNLSSCLHVKKLPAELGRLECLKELNIKDTGIIDLPDGIFGLQGLCIVASDGLSFTV